MSESEQPSRQLSVANDVVIKITKNIEISAGNFNLFDGVNFSISSLRKLQINIFLINNLSNHEFSKRE